MNKLKNLLLFIFIFTNKDLLGQNLSLYQQFNGRYNYTMIGNTHNTQENSFQTSPQIILTSTSATLNLNASDQIEKAYLYWAGCGTGDFEVKLNNSTITAERTFATNLFGTHNFFSAFADVTTLVQNIGSGTYTISDFDVNSFLNFHFPNRTNFAGWAMVIVFKNNNLPLNQLNVYDGLQYVFSQQQEITINLETLNVIDNQNANIGFLAWEGDVGLAVNETLRINGNTLSNPPLNPETNAFNGTNSILGTQNLFNMDLDVYNIQDFINPGDTSAEIKLTSGQDFVMVNAVITKLNSQLPDATSKINTVQKSCNSKNIEVNYTIFNNNATASLPTNVPISFYADNELLQTIYTNQIIPINNSISNNITLIIPNSISNNFTLKIFADFNGTSGTVIEINENNNTDEENIEMLVSPLFNIVENLTNCNQGFSKAIFNLAEIENKVKINNLDLVTFHISENDAISNINPINNLQNYEPTFTPYTIYIRIDNGNCYSITNFKLLTINCKPIIYNYVSANNDGSNDFFYIAGLRNIFLNFQLQIYNRWGVLIWEGNQNNSDWRGESKEGIVPDGTYYYILKLNDENYPEPFTGFVYFTK
jgi:gliding motility-associated-like protein